MEFETIIGVEVHIELSTKTKIFCACRNTFGAPVNTQVCPVCMGMPGSLPVLNQKVVDYAMALGLATHCTITPNSRFDRKNYFYPDNPQNYQISQLYRPIARDGYLEIETVYGMRKIRIHEMHMEEDAGKLIHKEDCSVVDYNRAGVPLIEVVSEPDMRNAEEVHAFLEQLRLTASYLGISDCKLNEGSMRVDVNLSVRERGTEILGTRTEMKNLNSFKAISRAIAHESERQVNIISNGGIIEQETRRWDDKACCSYSMRSKEDDKDYRYFPEPDLPPLEIDEEWQICVKQQIPELPRAKKQRYIERYGLSEYDAGILTSSKVLADFYEEIVAICKDAKKAANWMMGEMLRLLHENNQTPEDIQCSAVNVANIIMLTDKGVINQSTAKEVFEQVFYHDVNPKEYVQTHGLQMEQDAEAIRQLVMQVVEQNPQSVSDYHGGKKQAIGYLVGQTMKASGGKASPQVVNRMLLEVLAN